MKEKQGWTVRNALAATVVFVLLAAIFFVASSGPVIAIALRAERFQSSERVIRIYRPLVRACPQLMMPYLNSLWLSDLEMFFVLQEPQREITVKRKAR